MNQPNDERLNVSLTPNQADQLWRLMKAAQVVFPLNPPRYNSMASGSQLEAEAIRRWHASFKLSNVNLEELGIRLAEALSGGILDILERKDCPHPVIVDSGITRRCRRCMQELP